MQFVAAREACEGMCVAEDVCDPQGRVLIGRGQRLGTHHLVRMRKFRIRSIFIDPASGESLVKTTRSDLREQCQQVLADSCQQLKREFAGKRVALDAAAIKTATDNLLQALMRTNKPLVTLCEVGANSDRLLQHSVNVTVLGTLLALDLRAPRDLMHDFAVALLFHDVGMIFLPDALQQADAPPSERQIAAIQQHARLGFEHLAHSQAISQIACGLVLRHHELLNGEGYPRAYSAEKLNLLARIMAVVEAYDSLTSPRLGIPAVLPDAAISYIVSHADRHFDRKVVLALARRIALYPVGTAVQLTTGEYGVVAGLLPELPHRPVVLAHYDHRKVQFKQPVVVDLTTEKDRGVLQSAPALPHLLQAKEKQGFPASVDTRYANLG